MKKITRKIISPVKKDSPLEEKVVPVEKVSEERTEETDSSRSEVGKPKKACSFCQSKTNPSYTDMNVLRRFVTERAKLVPKLRSGLCSKHQRAMTKNVKYARHLALLSFTPKV